MFEKLWVLLHAYITLGADENTGDNDLKKITLLNIFCNTWHLFTVFSFVEDFLKDQLMITSYIIMFALVTSVQVLQYYKRFLAASILFISSLIGVILYFSNYLYKSELLEYYFLLPPAIALIYIDNKKINLTVLTVCLLGFYIPNLYFDHYPVSVLNNMNPPFLFFSMFVVISYFKNLNIRNEKILEAKTRELEELDKFKSQFFTNISHEIRTPLTLINGGVSDLEPFAATTPAVALVKRNIKKQINGITDIVDNILDLAKMQSSSFSLQLKPTNVSELVHKQWLSFEPLFKQKNINYNIYRGTEDYIAPANTVFLERTINNLIINALKYTNTGEVNITIFQQKELLHIAISDTGIGIASNELNAVFNRFYQVNNDINKAGGSGVGLAFSKEIIELHDGELLLKSEPNVGSKFTIILPLDKSQPAVSRTNTVPIEIEKEHVQQKNIEMSTYNFLIVEDNYDMRKYLISILPNYNCLEASNGLEALKIIEQKTVDFIITDYMMPKLNGHEFVKRLKEANNTIPVIMLTAKTDAHAKLDILKLGIDDYITKPFDKKELLARIDNCIQNYTTRKEYNEEHNITTQDDNFIVQLKQYVYQNSYNLMLSQEVISKEFNISKSSFYRKVKSHTGLSPNNFIKEIRLQKAREILEKKPTILLKQLALEVGFSHYTYFSQIYTKRFGTKPTKKI